MESLHWALIWPKRCALVVLTLQLLKTLDDFYQDIGQLFVHSCMSAPREPNDASCFTMGMDTLIKLGKQLGILNQRPEMNAAWLENEYNAGKCARSL